MRTRRKIGAQLWAYSTLVRVPNLFTAPPDVVLGAALATSAGAHVTLPLVAGLAFASMTLYAGGTTLNDAFDAPVDAVERPERPIPRGQVSQRRAFGLGAALLVVGAAVAFGTAGAPAALTAAGIAALSVLYNGLLKDTAGGYVAMGTTRGLNVMLGLVGASRTLAGRPWVYVVPVETWVYAVPVVTGAYVAAVTWMAAGETTGGRRLPIAAAAVGVVLAGAAVVGVLGRTAPPLVRLVTAVTLAGAFVWWTGVALRRAYADPTPGAVGPAVGTCVLGLVVLDGAFVAALGEPWALGAASFVLPAVWLARFFDVS